jgi:flagellar assembly protein FliH
VRELHDRIVDMERTLQRDLRQAHERGYREGEAAGYERAKTEMAPIAERLTRAIGDIAMLRPRIRSEAEADLVKLAFGIARRILRRELSVSPDAIQGLVRSILDKAQTREVCKVRVHPDHRMIVHKSLEASGLPPALEIVGDPTLRYGDAIVETKRGDLDGTIESQLAEIERGFADRLGN